MENIRISRPSDTAKKLSAIAALLAVFFFSSMQLNFDFAKFVNRLGNAGKILGNMAQLNLAKLPDILGGMLTSVCIALAGLALGLIVSLVLSFLAASNIAPNKPLASAIKGGVAIVRAVPALVWILMIVASLGFGNTSGVVGLVFPTTGYLTKSFIASIEERGLTTIEAMRTTGAPWILIVTKGLLPELIRPFASWIAIRAEGNIAESISLGMVGIGGIGSLLMKAIGKYDYASISTIILVIFLSMFAVENLVNLTKKKL